MYGKLQVQEADSVEASTP